MTHRTKATLILGATLLGFLPWAPHGADATGYQRRWYVVAGGGQISNTDVTSHYRLGATTGQPDVAISLGGVYRVRAGYWTLPSGVAFLEIPPDPPAAPVAFRAPTISPNPSAGASAVEFATSEECDVVLRVLDVSGRRVRELSRGLLGAGVHHVPWDGRDDAGRSLPSGIYFVTLLAGHHHGQAKLVMLSNGGSR